MIRNCEVCRIEFETKNATKYCSEKCRRKKRREQYREYWKKRRNDKEYLKRHRKTTLRFQEKWRLRAQKKLGSKCILCDYKPEEGQKRVSFHQIFGESHQLGTGVYKYIVEHIEDFVPLCARHHRMLHSLVRETKKEKFDLLLLLINSLASGRTK